MSLGLLNLVTHRYCVLFLSDNTSQPRDGSGAELGFKSENMYACSSPRGPELATGSVRAEHRRYNYRGRLSFSAAGAVVSAYLPLRSSATIFHTALPQSLLEDAANALELKGEPDLLGLCVSPGILR